jgi:VIT1/CCC1 family predicted Fe2+/Mn2+ transporter
MPESPQSTAKRRRHPERHFSGRIGWLRAAVLGANDGIVSTASLIVGVAAAQATPETVLTAGVAGMVAGAMSMAAGEYVSVSSQADTERADLERERHELEHHSELEHRELAAIYQGRGLEPALAREVANQLMRHDALGAHARDELGLSVIQKARPIQAAIASGAAFSVGAVLPLLTVSISPAGIIASVASSSIVFLALLGTVAARVGGANAWLGAARVTFWGALAMAVTAGVGAVFGIVV